MKIKNISLVNRLIMAVVRFQYDYSIIVYPILNHVKFKFINILLLSFSDKGILPLECKEIIKGFLYFDRTIFLTQ